MRARGVGPAERRRERGAGREELADVEGGLPLAHEERGGRAVGEERGDDGGGVGDEHAWSGVKGQRGDVIVQSPRAFVAGKVDVVGGEREAIPAQTEAKEMPTTSAARTATGRSDMVKVSLPSVSFGMNIRDSSRYQML